MTLLRDVIDIPTSVGDADFVVRASEGADLERYVVTHQLRENFSEALRRIGHALTTGQSQAMFLHGSFGSGKSHFMTVLREILQHNPAAREVRGLAEPVLAADEWLRGKKLLTLTFHMLDARSVEQAVLEGYLRQITALHPDAPVPAVHRSDALLDDAARLRERMGDDAFFAALRDGGAPAGGAAGTGLGLAAQVARAAGWTPATYAEAAAAAPGTESRDLLVSALTSAFFSGAVHSGEYLDLDAGLAVITRHAKSLGYDAMVLFLDELILWLSTRISDHTFVNTEGAKLNKLVESADAARPLPLVSFVARQRNLEDFLGPQVGGTEREALAHVMRSVQGRFGEIVLADTNLPEITEKRLLKPRDEASRAVIDNAFTVVRHNRAIWDILLLGAQYGDAGIGSDAAAFRKLYPFSPALVATLVALSQALQRERTALKVMTELLVERRDTLRVNDLIGVSALFDPLVLRGELPDQPKLKQLFQSARDLYLKKLRPILLSINELTGADEQRIATHTQFHLDDKLAKTVLLGALVPDVPALHNLTAAKLHALNFGTITAPIPGYENQMVLNRLRRIANDAGELHLSDGPDPVVSLKLHAVDYDKLLDLVPEQETTTTGVRQQLLRELITAEMGLAGADGQLGELLQPRDWRGRRHTIQVKFGNVRDPDSMPASALIATGDAWRVVIDYPFDPAGYPRNADRARIEQLDRGSRTVFWLPLYFTDEMMGRVAQLAKINYLLGVGGSGDRIDTLAADWPAADRQQGKVYLQQRQTQLRNTLLSALKQAYGVAAPQSSDVEPDAVGVLHTLANGIRIGDPRGGTLAEAFHNLTGELLAWSYPGRPALPDDEKPVTRGEFAKILEYAQRAAADETRGVNVPPNDQRTIRRICNSLQLGELVDHRYVLTTGTCRWSRHLLQAAANKGYTEHYPVHLLRELINQPEPFGFDRDLENLIIAVFALEQQLAWYEHSGKISVTSVSAVREHYQLRHPPMPSTEAWEKAVERGQALFGEKLPTWRTPTNLSGLAVPLRTAANQHRAHAAELMRKLEHHADVLGLDKSAATGRLATARRMAKLLEQLANERDDVVLVELLARADVGDLDDQAAGQTFKQAEKVLRALDQPHQWPLFQAMIVRVDDPRAAAIVADLRSAARHEQHGADLVKALQEAMEVATALLAEIQPKPPTVVVKPPENERKPQGGDADDEPERSRSEQKPSGGGSGQIVAPPAPEDKVLPPIDPRLIPPQQRQVTTAEEWQAVADEIRGLIANGKRVNLTWTAQ